jgi:signal transduction histidine kinase
MVMLGSIGVACASQKDDAKALVKKAAAYMKENGNEKAFAEISNQHGKFVKGDLYVFVFDPKGVMLAHGANAKLIGKNLYDLKDPDGVYFTRDILNVAKKGGGWTPKYKFTNPTSKKIENKITYGEPVGDLTVACGIYE